MDVTAWLAGMSALTAVAGVAWQVIRDIRKDRDDQDEAARDEAVRQALIEERLRHVEERGHDGG